LACHAAGPVRADGDRAGARMSDGLSEDYGDLGERRNRRVRIVAWVTIVSLILVGGGATTLAVLFG
ncbi:hypothetical protein, partial [Microbacterium sp. S308A+]